MLNLQQIIIDGPELTADVPRVSLASMASR